MTKPSNSQSRRNCSECGALARGTMCKPCRNRTNKLLYASTRVKCDCLICGNHIGMYPKSLAIGYKYCSKECHFIFRSKQFSGKWTQERIDNHSKTKTRDKVVKHGDYQCDKCDKKFQTNTSLRAHRSYCSHDDPGPTKCPTCDELFKSERSWKIHNEHMHLASDEQRNIRHEKISIDRNSPNRIVKYTSDSEKKFVQNLRELLPNIEIISPYRDDKINHAFDIYIPYYNWIIEYDGNYWHGDLKFYDYEDRFEEQWERDLKWSRLAVAQDYNFCRVWELDSHIFLKEVEDARFENIKNLVDKKKWYHETCLRHPGKREP